MSRVLMALLVGCGCLYCGNTPARGQPPAGNVPAVKVVNKYVLGVDGYNTNKGFKVTSVFAGYPSTRLFRGGVPYALQTGDYITKVDGKPINNAWTLQQAIAA